MNIDTNILVYMKSSTEIYDETGNKKQH